MPRICYVEKKFNSGSKSIIAAAIGMLEEFAEDGLVVTLRQLYYRFVSRDLIPNTEQSYKRLGSIVNDARLAGLLDWEAIEDRARSLIKTAHWESPEDIIEACASQFRIDKWSDQYNRVEVWVEKQALEAVVEVVDYNNDGKLRLWRHKEWEDIDNQAISWGPRVPEWTTP